MNSIFCAHAHASSTDILQLLAKLQSGASGLAQRMMGLIQNSRGKTKAFGLTAELPPKHCILRLYFYLKTIVLAMID